MLVSTGGALMLVGIHYLPRPGGLQLTCWSKVNVANGGKSNAITTARIATGKQSYIFFWSGSVSLRYG